MFITITDISLIIIAILFGIVKSYQYTYEIRKIPAFQYKKNLLLRIGINSIFVIMIFCFGTIPYIMFIKNYKHNIFNKALFVYLFIACWIEILVLLVFIKQYQRIVNFLSIMIVDPLPTQSNK